MGLLNSTVLEWAIGIVFVYLLLAIVCTTINEWVAGATGVRSKTLKQAIDQLLDQQKGSDDTKSFLDQFWEHPLISGMKTPGKAPSAAHPSYLQARTFATAVIDLATKDKPGSISFADLETGVKDLPDGDVKKALLALIQNASGELDVAQKNIENWFNDTMDRASGWYKRKTQFATIVIAALLTIVTNADTVRIGHILWTNNTVRSMLVEKAKAHTEASAGTTQVTYPDKNKPLSPFKAKQDELDALKPLLGWAGEDLKDLSDWRVWPPRLLGWLLSTAAISLGAPFWFDLLNKMMNLRNAGKRPDDSPKKQNSGNPPAPQAPVPVKAGG